MKNVFLTEGFWTGKIPRHHPDMRNDSAWMHLLDAIHIPLMQFDTVQGYDNVFVMFPKGRLNLSMEGMKIADMQHPYSNILALNFIQTLKNNNKKVHFIQEGPTYLFNDYEIIDQFNYFNMLSEVDTIFAHNEYDKSFYEGLFPNKTVDVIPPILIEDLICDIVPSKQDKVIIGGNFANWYGGFQSYILSDEFKVPKYIQDSHAKRIHEDMIEDLTHIPRKNWLEWMRELSTFKYAIHLMPTPAAGTFSLNCAYFGIPCIGNQKVDTQKLCHPDLAVDVYDLKKARELAKKLVSDKDFYILCSNTAKENYRKYYDVSVWENKLYSVIDEKRKDRE